MASCRHSIERHSLLADEPVVSQVVSTEREGLLLITGQPCSWSSVTRCSTKGAEVKTFRCSYAASGAGLASVEAYTERIAATPAASSSSDFMGSSSSLVQERRTAAGLGLGQAPSARRSLNCRTEAFVRRITRGHDAGMFEVGVFVCCDGDFCCETGRQCPGLADIAAEQFAALPALTAPQLYSHVRSLPEAVSGGRLCVVSKSACSLALWRLRRKHKAAAGGAAADPQRTMVSAASRTLCAGFAVRALCFYSPRPPLYIFTLPTILSPPSRTLARRFLCDS